MSVDGYKVISVKTEFYQSLKTKAEINGKSMHEYLQSMVLKDFEGLNHNGPTIKPSYFNESDSKDPDIEEYKKNGNL